MADTWIGQTRQRWKLYVFWLLFGIGALLLIAFIWSVNNETSPDPVLAAGFVTFIGVSFVWLFSSIRCPKCGGRPAWWIVRHASANDWFVAIAGMRACPICNDQAVHRVTSPQRSVESKS